MQQRSPAAGAARAPSLGVQQRGRDETSVPKVERTRRIWRGTERKTHAHSSGVVSGGAVLPACCRCRCALLLRAGAVQVQQALVSGPQVLQSQDGR